MEHARGAAATGLIMIFAGVWLTMGFAQALLVAGVLLFITGPMLWMN